MRRLSALPAALLAALPLCAAATPSFKSAPASEETAKQESGSGWADFVPIEIDTEAAPPWAQTGIDFLANNYGYIGVAAVLLMLFLFARGGRGDDASAAKAGSAEDDFFEPGDADRYRRGSRR